MGEELAAGAGLTSPRDSAAYLKARLCHLPHEVFACLFLDNRHRVLAFEEMFRGTLDGASVHPREVVRAALEHNAAAVILAHNHPSGVAEPSAADRNITPPASRRTAASWCAGARSSGGRLRRADFDGGAGADLARAVPHASARRGQQSPCSARGLCNHSIIMHMQEAAS
jgi:proteasome lid subunit RPN8/RPN11